MILLLQAKALPILILKKFPTKRCYFDQVKLRKFVRHIPFLWCEASSNVGYEIRTLEKEMADKC